MASGKFGDWDRARSTFDTMAERAKDAAHNAVLQEGHFLRGKIVQGIADQAPGGQAFKPLSLLTLAARKMAGFAGTKALIRHGDLRNGVTVMDKRSLIFIGVPKAASGKNGKPLVDIAAIHEFGAGPFTVRITDKMRKYIAVLMKKAGVPRSGGGGGGKGFLTIRIPARPFIGPVFKQFGATDDVKKRLEERMAKMLKGFLAR